MGLIFKTNDFFRKRRESVNEKSDKENLLEFLKKLKALESKLWGITISEIAGEEEKLLEDANHIIQVFSKNDVGDMKKVLSFKEVNEFINEVQELREDFKYFKRLIKEQDRLKNHITKYTIKLVTHRNFQKLEKIFLLEKQLYEVIDKQDFEFEELFKNFSKIRNISKEKKVESFIEVLKKIRTIFAGHMDHHSLWEEERLGFSNTSNILHSLIKVVELEDIEPTKSELELSQI